MVLALRGNKEMVLRMLTKKDGRDAEYIPPILVPSGDAYLSSR